MLARAGVCSRRDAERWIAEGRVKVNGRVLASPAVNVTERDNILVDGVPLPTRERTRLWLYNKPGGLVTTARDEKGRPTVFDRLPEDMPRVLSIGRLDLASEAMVLAGRVAVNGRVIESPALNVTARDAILVVEGGLAWDDFAGALRLRARRVLTLNEACERQAKLLRIKCNGIGADFLPALHATLAGYRGGQTPLRVQYANTAGSAEIELGPEWRVRATADLKRSLDAMPGVKSTDWVLGRAGSA